MIWTHSKSGLPSAWADPIAEAKERRMLAEENFRKVQRPPVESDVKGGRANG